MKMNALQKLRIFLVMPWLKKSKLKAQFAFSTKP